MRARTRGNQFLPDYLGPAHDLCLLNHDVLVELLNSGEAQGAFSARFKFSNDSDRELFETSADIFEWFERTERTQDRARFLRRTVFPALLSDFLHFVFEALETSRKAKLNVSYALIRKPLQENLFLLEIIATDLEAFANGLVQDPLSLRSQKAGGLVAHTRRIARAINILGEEDRFDAAYLAQLRYDKNSDDSFDGVCNKAVHLFTGHDAIQTERLNVNFIFSDWDGKLTQWYYLYSRLPYVLFYARRLVEHVCATFSKTDPVYLDDIERRVAAGTLLWAKNIDEGYRHAAIERFVTATRDRLALECHALGHHEPSVPELGRMLASGALPGESPVRTGLRNATYSVASLRRRLQRALATAGRTGWRMGRFLNVVTDREHAS